MILTHLEIRHETRSLITPCILPKNACTIKFIYTHYNLLQSSFFYNTWLAVKKFYSNNIKDEIRWKNAVEQ